MGAWRSPAGRAHPAGAVLLLLFLAGCRAASVDAPVSVSPMPPAFRAKPTAVREGDNVRIRFAVNTETDVAVAILDAQGRVVRHLAAGRLGPNAPEPLQKYFLTQDIVWDGRDDNGCQVSSVGRQARESIPHRSSAAASSPTPDARHPTPFRVRVSLGLRPVLDRYIGFQPETLGGVRALATGPDGSLYVFHCYGSSHPHDDSGACAVFSRDGKYLKTIIPYPAGLPEEKLKGLRRLDAGNGVKVPFIYQFETRSFIPGLGDLPRQRAVVTRDGRLAFVGVQEGPHPFAQAGEARLTVVHTDGSVPADGVLRTRIHTLTDTAASLALSPDEKTLYAAGVRACIHEAVGLGGSKACQHCVHDGSTWAHTAPTRTVYRFEWDDADASPFGKAVAFQDAVSVATDGDGNVYVADVAGDRVIVLRPDGQFLNSFPVNRPQRVEVHRKSGAIYVLSGEQKIEVIKLTPSGSVVSRQSLPLSASYPPRRPVMALDDSAEPAVLWFNGPLIRVEDRGSSFGEPANVVANAPAGEPGSIRSVMSLSLDRARGLLYVNNTWRYDTVAGTWQKNPTNVTLRAMWPVSTPASASGTVGLDGHYYVCPGAQALVHRFGPDLNGLPFPAAINSAEGSLRGFAKDFDYGHTADAAGNVYVLWKKCPADPGDVDRAHALYSYAPDGRLRKEKLVNSDIPYVRAIRVDGAGNLYLLAGLRPGRSTLPPGLQGQVPEGRRDPDAVNGINAYPLIYGSVVKFGPEGGSIRRGNGGVRCNYGYGDVTHVQGAQWIVPGASVVCSWGARNDGVYACRCELPGFDVDGFGRSFFCDAGRFRVGVLDPAGNPIGWFGSYGNQDSAGPGSAIPTPEIAFAWPQAVAVDDQAAYVGDRLNRRIARVKLAYAAEETCEVPGTRRPATGRRSGVRAEPSESFEGDAP